MTDQSLPLAPVPWARLIFEPNVHAFLSWTGRRFFTVIARILGGGGDTEKQAEVCGTGRPPPPPHPRGGAATRKTRWSLSNCSTSLTNRSWAREENECFLCSTEFICENVCFNRIFFSKLSFQQWIFEITNLFSCANGISSSAGNCCY